ncbi:MAG: putative toxin-antitoxin system toxin component, PIN family, partial [Chloroflexi bacterium]|nr:putative toxin-antitoxin system toxin component, PIN family [Chloroflexota bacterium]
MIVVLDTNIIVSSVLSLEGAPAQIIRRWEADEFDVLTSPLLLAELERSLKYNRVQKYYKKPQESIDALVERLKAVALIVEPSLSLDEIHDDPDDNRVLECAVDGRASYIVSGDAHLLDLRDYKGIMILKPKDFLAVLKNLQ